MRPNSMGIPQI